MAGKTITMTAAVELHFHNEKVITLCEASTAPCDKLLQSL